LKLTSSVLDLSWAEVAARIERFIEDYVKKTGAKGTVLGLSGGIDSCTVAALSALAIGGSRVLGLMLPEEETRSTADIKHAKLVAKKFKVKTLTCDITPGLRAVYNSIPLFDPSERVCKGNIKARTRMIYWYYYANKLNLIVCGCSDKSETMMGYFTKWGDVAADVFPIMDLYKTQVRKLAQHIGIPKEIVGKPSTPALWPGQVAETELGVKYEQLDLILYGLECFMKPEEIAKQLSVEKETVEKVKARWLSMEHKRRMLLTAKLEYRTIGTDFRLQRNYVHG
jgi:NAD+ synthase